MKYLRKYESHEDIDAMCRKYGIQDYSINSDGYVNAYMVYLSDYNLSELPLKFGNIQCYFDCSHNDLTSLEGCPKSVNSYLDCSDNDLTSLEGCPKWVNGFFACSANRLTSLKYCPKTITGNFYCHYNEIETFEGLDFINIGGDIGGDFDCAWNPIWEVWRLFRDHTKFEFFNDCDPIRENRVIILDRLNFFLDYINKPIVTEVRGYKCI